MSVFLPECVLLVEDEAITRWQILDALHGMGIEKIHESENASQAKEILRREAVEFILMDINLESGQDGISLAREIVRTYRVPIVFITAYTDDEIFEETIQLSPYGFLGKPFVKRELQRTVRMAWMRFVEENFSVVQKKKTDTFIYLANDYRYDPESKRLFRADEPIPIRGKQAEFVDILCRNPQTIMSYHALMNQLWDEDISLSSLRTVVYTLRKSLPDFPIINHSKVGYSVEMQVMGSVH